MPPPPIVVPENLVVTISMTEGRPFSNLSHLNRRPAKNGLKIGMTSPIQLYPPPPLKPICEKPQIGFYPREARSAVRPQPTTDVQHRTVFSPSAASCGWLRGLLRGLIDDGIRPLIQIAQQVFLLDGFERALGSMARDAGHFKPAPGACSLCRSAMLHSSTEGRTNIKSLFQRGRARPGNQRSSGSFRTIPMGRFRRLRL
jgi:hypothetical protein